MKVEHITLYGKATIRDTATILPPTRRALDAIGLSYESRIITLPVLPFKIRITATDEGALFDIMSMKGEPAITNFCCFEKKSTKKILSYVDAIADWFRKRGLKINLIEPVTPQWLYTAIVNPQVISPADIMTAGEVGLYIYEQLYLAFNNTRKKQTDDL